MNQSVNTQTASPKALCLSLYKEGVHTCLPVRETSCNSPIRAWRIRLWRVSSVGAVLAPIHNRSSAWAKISVQMQLVHQTLHGFSSCYASVELVMVYNNLAWKECHSHFLNLYLSSLCKCSYLYLLQ